MPPSPPALALPEPASSGESERLPAGDFDPRLAALPDHLVLLRVLGQGGSSVVYEALHTRLKVKVAIKLLTIEGPHAEQAQRRMLREAELYALLDDPRIPRVYDVNELPDRTPYVVMEMVPGESLEELLARRGALPATLALEITREVLLALASVHERGVLHRDVKPANVILSVTEQGPDQVRLVDFGIAKMSARGSGEEAVTQRGTLVGTPHYMAPERLAGHPADTSTDVYAVGIMLYEMLSGRVPYTGTSLPAIMSAVMRDEPVALANITPALSAFVMTAMARDPHARFPSAAAMLSALELLQPAALPPAVQLRVRQSRRGKLLFLAAMLATLLVATGFLLAERHLAARAEMATPSSAPLPISEPDKADPAHAPAGRLDVVMPSSLAARPLEPTRAEPVVSELQPEPSMQKTRAASREREPRRARATRDPSLPANPY